MVEALSILREEALEEGLTNGRSIAAGGARDLEVRFPSSDEESPEVSFTSTSPGSPEGFSISDCLTAPVGPEMSDGRTGSLFVGGRRQKESLRQKRTTDRIPSRIECRGFQGCSREKGEREERSKRKRG